MSGYLLIVERRCLYSIARSHQLKMLLLSVFIGSMAGVLVAKVRLGLGMPGHRILSWMTPVLIARLRGKCRIGTTTGGISAALTARALGGNLAGGLMGLPTVVLSSIVMDLTVDFLERNGASGVKMVPAMGLAGIVANLVCLANRMLLPAGLNPHFFFGLSTHWFRLCSYMFFGFSSGVIAAMSSRSKRQSK